MRPVHQLEIKVGLLVLAGLIAAIAMVMTADKLRIERTYRVTAYLKDAGGLRFESPVTLSGIAVGKVQAIEFVVPGDHAPGRVRATVTIAQGVILPADVEARLATSGVFGDSSLALSSPISTAPGSPAESSPDKNSPALKAPRRCQAPGRQCGRSRHPRRRHRRHPGWRPSAHRHHCRQSRNHHQRVEDHHPDLESTARSLVGESHGDDRARRWPGLNRRSCDGSS